MYGRPVRASRRPLYSAYVIPLYDRRQQGIGLFFARITCLAGQPVLYLSGEQHRDMSLRDGRVRTFRRF